MAKKLKKKDSGVPGKGPKDKEQTGPSLNYPLWANLLVVLSLLGWLGCAALFTGMTQCSVEMMREAFDPAYIAASMKKIAKFDKLPPGFKPQLAAYLMNARLLTLQYAPDRTGIMLWILPAEKRRETSRQLADIMADKGIPTISDEFKIDEKSSLSCAGEKVEYVTGEASDRRGYEFGGFIGCAILKDQRALLVYAWTPGAGTGNATGTGSGVSTASGTSQGTKFNMDAMQKLFSAIKSF